MINHLTNATHSEKIACLALCLQPTIRRVEKATAAGSKIAAAFYLLMMVRLIFHDQKGERMRPWANRRSWFDIEVTGTGLWSR